MTWVPIQVGCDHLEQFAKKNPIDALAELIWNGLDAEALTVDVDVQIASLGDGPRDQSYVTKVTVADTGHGIDPARAQEQFASLGDSWKRTLNGRTLNNERPLHGSRGRGRFYAYSLGSRLNWSSISRFGDGYRRVEISGDVSRINGFQVDDVVELSEPSAPGTVATVYVQQGRPLSSLIRDDLELALTARLAIHLLGNPDLVVCVNGTRLDPRPLIEGSPIDLQLAVSVDDYVRYERPVLTIVDWIDSVRVPTGVVLCTADGAALIEIEKSAAPGNVRSTGYLRWSGWATTGPDLLLAQVDHGPIIDAAREAMAQHIDSRATQLTATIVATLKEEDAYPYPDQLTDPVQETERQLFDLIAVTARTPLRASSKPQRKMTARLLKLALQERPESLDLILADALALSEAERDQLAELLRHTTLSRIVSAAAEITRRLDLIGTLRHIVYTPGVASEMREVDQLHPLVKDNVWLFGESWRLSASEVGLTNVLRAVARDDLALESDLVRKGNLVLLPEGRRGRVDLLMQRTLIGPDDQQSRLVVELKRPSVKLGDKELGQIKRYARALAGHPGVGESKWTFWLVGSDVRDEIAGDLQQTDRDWGHVIATDKYDVRVTSWGTLLDQTVRRFQFYKEQLAYDASQDESVARVRRLHQELLPS
jgi:hypothetical protein